MIVKLSEAMSGTDYTAEQLAKRNASMWTRVQMVLAPLQFLAFLVSLTLVIRYLLTGEGYMIANLSVLFKITLLWLITVTGMIWEKEIFGHWFWRRSSSGKMWAMPWL